MENKNEYEENIRDIDEALETFCLILYSCATLPKEEITQYPKAVLSIQLIYDILNIVIYKVEPWFIEQIII